MNRRLDRLDYRHLIVATRRLARERGFDALLEEKAVVEAHRLWTNLRAGRLTLTELRRQAAELDMNPSHRVLEPQAEQGRSTP